LIFIAPYDIIYIFKGAFIMRWTYKKDSYLDSHHLVARHKGYKLNIEYSDTYKVFYFLTEDKDENTFNSLWEQKAYKTEEECKQACIKWVYDKLMRAEL
jgi:hypothetical protein